MKALVCEMCSGNDFSKIDGMFVCENCGTKYSPEEAKKMMIEGTVDVKGTVKVDNSQMVEKYLQNARRAKQKEDWAEVEKYYNFAEQEDPTNIEAIFYSAFGKAKQTLVDADLYKRQAAFKVLIKSVSIIDDNFDVSKEEEQYELVTQIVNDVNVMRGSSFVYNTTRRNNITTDDRHETESLFYDLWMETLTTLSNIEKKLQNKDRKIKTLNYIITALERYVMTERRMEILSGLYTRLKDLDPNVNLEAKLAELKEKLEKEKASNNAKGCLLGIFWGLVIGGIIGSIIYLIITITA